MVKCFITMLWMGLDGCRALHALLGCEGGYARLVRRACGLGRLPDRRTFDRRFKALDEELSRRVIFTGGLLCLLGVVDPAVTASDSTLIRAWKGRAWHERRREQGRVPCSLDVEAGWGRSRVKGWAYGWKGYVASTTKPIPVCPPLRVPGGRQRSRQQPLPGSLERPP